MSFEQKVTNNYTVTYKVTYPAGKEPKTGQFVHINMHPREDQVLRQVIKLEPDLAEADYLAIKIQLNPANLGYKPYFGFDKASIRAFLDQMKQYT